MRSHSQAVTLQLKENITLDKLEKLLADSSPWTTVISNELEETQQHLTPEAVSGRLDIHVGRVNQTCKLRFLENSSR